VTLGKPGEWLTSKIPIRTVSIFGVSLCSLPERLFLERKFVAIVARVNRFLIEVI
jgi:hypothetical protein